MCASTVAPLCLHFHENPYYIKQKIKNTLILNDNGVQPRIVYFMIFVALQGGLLRS